MGAVTTLVATVAVAAGAIAFYRFIDRRSRALKDVISDAKVRAGGRRSGKIIDYERDPESGVYKPRS